jgi:GMP synthase (glutamine-hydrolysing)
MILVVYFDVFHKDLEKRLIEHKIPFTLVKYADLKQYKPAKPIKIIIIAGSKQRILRSNDFPLLEAYMTQDIHIIGICFGFQLLAYKTGGKVVEGPLFRGIRPLRPTDERHIMSTNERPTDKSPIENLYFNHHDRVIELPNKWMVVQRIDGFINIAATDKWIGFQFHPEKYDATFRHYLLPFLCSS